MISRKASNWVDRGEAPDGVVQRVLSSYLHLDSVASADQLQEYVRAVLGMVQADATEVQLGGYLSTLEEAHGITDRLPRHRRSVGIALWHIVKAAEVRDRALRMLRERPEFTSSRQELSDWLLDRFPPAEPDEPTQG
jgi:hypothetical protein